MAGLENMIWKRRKDVAWRNSCCDVHVGGWGAARAFEGSKWQCSKKLKYASAACAYQRARWHKQSILGAIAIYAIVAV
jgi:hypothetical protein